MSLASVNIDPLCSAVLETVREVLHDTPASLHEPEFAGNEWTYVKDCLDTGWVSSVGSYVDRFEQMLGDYTGAGGAVATVNGTAALHACLVLAGVRAGDEVLIPSLTFVATANAVSYLGATPHLVDSEPATLGLCAARLQDYLSHRAELRDGGCYNRDTGAPIRAIVPMHTFGHPVALDALLALCERWQLTLIEDAAESLGSWYRERHTGTFGALACLSFNGNKVVTTGGGGAILVRDEALRARAKHLTTTARVGHAWNFLHDEVGYNYRLPNLNAALGCAQLERLDEVLARKRRLAARYAQAFAAVPGVHLFTEPAHCRSNYWLNALLLDEPDQQLRDELLGVLNQAGVMARPAWTLMHELPMYRDCPRMDLDGAEALQRRIVNLPSSAFL